MKKMIMAIVPREEVGRTLEALVAAGNTATFSESRGGVLRQAQETLFIVVDETELDQVLEIIRDSCRTSVANSGDALQDRYALGPVPVTAELGGAIVFIWNVDRVETY
jgi:uncharacterized protein YaaQ